MFHVAFLSDRNATRIHIHPASPAGSYHTYLKAIPISFSPRSFPSEHYPSSLLFCMMRSTRLWFIGFLCILFKIAVIFLDP